MLKDIITRVEQTDPARADRRVSGHDVTVWVDTSSLATGVVESNGNSFEDASWLRSICESKRIDLVELNVMLKGVNLALQWEAIVIDLGTNSAAYIAAFLTRCQERRECIPRQHRRYL